MKFWNRKNKNIHNGSFVFKPAVRISSTYPESTYRLEINTDRSIKFLRGIWGVRRVVAAKHIPSMYWVDKKWWEEIESLRKRIVRVLAE